MLCVSHSVVSDALRPRGCSPPSSVHAIFPSNNTGVGCHFLPQGIFLIQGSNRGLLHCWQTLYILIHEGSTQTLSRVFQKTKNNNNNKKLMQESQSKIALVSYHHSKGIINPFDHPPTHLCIQARLPVED